MADAQSTHGPDPALRAADIASLFRGTINSTEVRLANLDGQLWFCLADVVLALGYSKNSHASTTWRRIFRDNGRDLDAYLRRVYGAAAASTPAWFINLEGLRVACFVLRLGRGEPLRAWLDALPSEVESNAAAPARQAPGSALSHKAYCAKLADVIAGYLTPEEVPQFATTLEAFARTVTARRYCPGLNDAAYDLYASASNLRKGG